MQDVGFGGISPELGLDSTVINKYFDWHFPTAIRLGRYLRRRAGSEQHIWTTHSFLVSLYLSCPPGMGLHCPTPAQQELFCEAARDGIVTWHAFPFNTQMEMMNPELLQGAFQLTEDVDLRCAVDHKTVISQVRLQSSAQTHMRNIVVSTMACLQNCYLLSHATGHVVSSGPDTFEGVPALVQTMYTKMASHVSRLLVASANIFSALGPVSERYRAWTSTVTG